MGYGCSIPANYDTDEHDISNVGLSHANAPSSTYVLGYLRFDHFNIHRVFNPTSIHASLV